MKIFDKIAQWIVKVLVFTLLRPKIYYQDKAKQNRDIKEPSILVCNHIHDLDGPSVMSIMRKSKVHNLAALDRYDDKMLSWLMKMGGCIPIDRLNLSTDWIYRSIDTLKKDKESIAIFPEGRHGKDGKILPFHSGITTIATLSQVPIILVYINGPYRYLFGKRLKLMIGTPFYLEKPTQGITSDYIDSQTKLLREKLIELQAEFYKLDTKKTN